MKRKTTLVAAGCMTLLLLYTSFGMEGKPDGQKKYIIIGYAAWGSEISVFAGGNDLPPINCRKRDVSNCVVEIMSQYQAEGYRLVSTTSAPSTFTHEEKNGIPKIYVFMEKE